MGIVRAGAASATAGDTALGQKLNTYGEQLVAQGLPPYTEMSRLGLGWQVMNTVALASLVVRPSTVAGLTLFNNNPAGGRSFVLDRLFAFNLVSTAAQARAGMWACIHPTGTTRPTADITAIRSMSGKPSYDGGAIVDTGATVVDDGWFPIGNWADTEPTGVLPGGIMEFKAEGRFVVPPTAAISITVVSSAAATTYTHGFAWYEIALPTNP